MNNSNKEVAELANNFFSTQYKSNSKWPFTKFYYKEHIPPDKLNNAREHYANFNLDNENVLILFDDTAWGSAKKGLVMTDSHIYFSESPGTSLALNDILTIELKKSLVGFSISLVHKSIQEERKLISGFERSVIYCCGTLPKNEAKVLNSFFTRLSKRNLEALWNNKNKVEELQNQMMSTVSNIMLDGEEVIYFACGTDFDSFVACTSSRIILYYTSWLSVEKKRDIEYSKITSVDSAINYYRNDFGEEPILQTKRLLLHADGSHTDIDVLQPFQVDEISKVIENKKRTQFATQNNNEKDIVKKLHDLKKLLEEGVLTQDEFNKAKQKILE